MAPRSTKILLFLLFAQSVGSVVLLPYYAFTQQDGRRLQVFAIALAAFALITIASVWLRKTWALWAVLTLVSFKLTVDLFNWSFDLNRSALPLSMAINAGIIALVFAAQVPQGERITQLQRLYFGCVLTLAGMIGLWGLLMPEAVLRVLPFSVPPLHARFLGSMYLSGATFMALCIAARQWLEVRLVVLMIAIWTGMLGLVSLLRLPDFDFGRVQVWVWFVAYIGFPLVAAWMAWQQRRYRGPAVGPPLSPWLRWYFWLQGSSVTLLALLLVLAPAAAASLWPWKITPILAQIYSAPFLAYGLGSLQAARQHTWAEVRIVVYATLVFALSVLTASWLHASLFSPGAIATWLWFGGFATASLGLALFGLVSPLREQQV